jgi:hypothetical protein
MTRERYPLGLCMAAIVATSLGLSAAALGVTWGAAPAAAGDAFRGAWRYVNVAAAGTWLLIWPATVLRPSQPELLAPRELLWSYAALWIGMLPALAASAVLSATAASAIASALGLQFTVSALAFGMLALAGRLRSPAASALLAAWLAIVALVVPIAVFLWSEFFPR